jgi:hypothetical protein
MAQPISAYMTGDIYAPVISKSSLQQWDNYQIHSVYCVDSIRSEIINSNPPIDATIKFTSFLAVQSYGLNDIDCNFDSIAQLYP